MDEALALAIKILSKTMDSTQLGPEKCKLFLAFADKCSGVCHTYKRRSKIGIAHFYPC